MRKLSEIQTDFDKAMEAENGADDALKYLKELNKAKEELKTLLIEIPLERLQEIALAEKAGTLIIPPCKVGDTVYVADYWGKKVQDFIINFITYDGEKTLYWEHRDLQPITPDIWGKTVFLTKEAAEKALGEAEEA